MWKVMSWVITKKSVFNILKRSVYPITNLTPNAALEGCRLNWNFKSEVAQCNRVYEGKFISIYLSLSAPITKYVSYKTVFFKLICNVKKIRFPFKILFRSPLKHYIRDVVAFLPINLEFIALVGSNKKFFGSDTLKKCWNFTIWFYYTTQNYTFGEKKNTDKKIPKKSLKNTWLLAIWHILPDYLVNFCTIYQIIKFIILEFSSGRIWRYFCGHINYLLGYL